MDFSMLNRKYKDDTPLETINKIRQILSDVGLFVFEQSWFNPTDNLFSTTIMTTSDFGSFHANGKSQTRDYALASAYGEFIERLQNNNHLINIPYILYESLQKYFGFYSYPDEVFLNEKELHSLPSEILSDLFSSNNTSEYFKIAFANNEKGCLAVPFFDTKNNRIINIPYNQLLSLTGSNGMSAGNSAPEAICQAMFELMERWAASQVFFNKLTPPTIPSIEFEKYKDEYNIIQEIENYGFTVVIKDFSCGINLPVLGLLMIDKNEHKYFLNIGCDSSIKIALSRCLTEIYQGVASINSIKQRMMNIPEPKDSMQIEELASFLINGSGVYPAELFFENPSYSIDLSGFKCQKNFKEECSYWTSYFINLGYSVYLRDVSFLGFPAFHVYIPSVSIPSSGSDDKHFNFSEAHNLKKAINNCYYLNNTFKIDSELLRSIINTFSKLDYNERVTSIFGLEIDNGQVENVYQYSVANFLIILSILNRDYKAAKNIVKKYSSICNNNKDYVFLKSCENIISCIRDDVVELKCDYDNCNLHLFRKLYDYIKFNPYDTKEIIKYLQIPTCPDCNECFWYKYCQTRGRLRITSLVNPIFKKNNDQISQLNLCAVINQENNSGDDKREIIEVC